MILDQLHFMIADVRLRRGQKVRQAPALRTLLDGKSDLARIAPAGEAAKAAVGGAEFFVSAGTERLWNFSTALADLPAKRPAAGRVAPPFSE
jgi:hypothetical protein